MSNDENVDINKVFEDLLLTEDTVDELSYKEGYEVGKKQLLDGFHLGYHRGSLLGAQLGFYSGVLERYLGKREVTDQEKTVDLAREVLRAIENFPRFNDDSVDIHKTMDDIKFKYTKFCSLAKLRLPYPESNTLDF